LLRESQENIWKILAGGDLLRIFLTQSQFFDFQIMRLPFDCVLGLSAIREGEEEILGKAIGLHDFAKTFPDWIMTVLAPEIEQTNLRKYLAEFDSVIKTNMDLGPDELESIRDVAGK
jgi:hypothetical protein